MLCGCGNQKQVKIVKYCENGNPVYSDKEKTEISKCEIIDSVEPTSITCEDEDFTYNEETKKCENIISIPANRRLGCKDEEKYVLKNGACHPKNGKGAVKYKINVYSCPESGTLNGKNCDFVDENDPEIECPEGYEANLKTAMCEHITYEEFKEREE